MANYKTVANRISRAAFTTSDKGASLLWNKYANQDREMLMREYVYLKSAMAIWLLKDVANSSPDAKQTALLIAEETRILLMNSCQFDFAGWGCNAIMLDAVIQKCERLSGKGMFPYVFWENTNKVVSLVDCTTVCELAEDYIAEQAHNASKSSGCLSTIACMVAIAVGLMALVI